MIEVENLVKIYGQHRALDGVSFSVAEGEVLGFLGPNGAGKSTTMNIITGYLSATEGSVTVNGYDILEQPDKAKMSIGYLPEQPPLYLDMTVWEYLGFIYALKKCKLPREKHLEQVMKQVRVDQVAKRLIKNLSKGYRQRVGLAQALIGDPPVLILDEPTVGLDPNQIIEIRSLIRELGKHHTVILSSHILSEIESVCGRIVIIDRGHIVADDSAQALSDRFSSDRRMMVTVAGPRAGVAALLAGIPGVERVDTIAQREEGVFEYALTVSEGRQLRYTLFDRLADRHWPLLASYSKQLSLEEIFLQLTQGDLAKKSGGDAL